VFPNIGHSDGSLLSRLRAVALLRASANGGEREFIFLVIPDIVYRESLLIAVIPDNLCYLGLFRMDPRLQLAGMTEGGWIPA
jgi:hypothetical protein